MGSQIYIVGTSNNEYILKTMKNIFAKIFVTGVMLGCVLVMPVWAAASNGCDNYEYEYINPEVALCTVHAYNIGSEVNPDYSRRSEMQEVIALKTTIITQQMYKQYEYLEAMIRRLKTQLEKATLTAALQAAGAKSSGDGTESDANWKDKDRDIFMESGITNCKTKLGKEERFNCYRSNIDAIHNQSSYGNDPTPEMKKQLVHEMTSMQNTYGVKNNGVQNNGVKNNCVFSGCSNNGMKAKTFKECIDKAYDCLNEVQNELNTEKRIYAPYRY